MFFDDDDDDDDDDTDAVARHRSWVSGMPRIWWRKICDDS